MPAHQHQESTLHKEGGKHVPALTTTSKTEGTYQLVPDVPLPLGS